MFVFFHITFSRMVMYYEQTWINEQTIIYIYLLFYIYVIVVLFVILGFLNESL